MQKLLGTSVEHSFFTLKVKKLICRNTSCWLPIFLICITSFGTLLTSSAHAERPPTETVLGRTLEGAEILFVDSATDAAATGRETAQQEVLVNMGQEQIESIEVFHLANPNRIVLDLEGVRSRKNFTFTLPKVQEVSTVRIGSHPNKFRLVVDLSTSHMPRYKWRQDKQSVRLFLFPGEKRKSVKAELRAKLREDFNDSSGVTSHSPVDSAPTDIEQPALETVVPPVVAPEILSVTKLERIPSQLAAVRSDQEPKALTSERIELRPDTPQSDTLRLDTPRIDDSTPQVTGIAFRRLEEDDTPAIVLSLNRRPEFSLTKAKTGKYTVVLKAHQLSSEQLKLPYFPPHDFEGLNGIQLSENKDGVMATVLVDPEVKLVSFTRNQEVFLKTRKK